jgi:hypothetical protein
MTEKDYFCQSGERICNEEKHSEILLMAPNGEASNFKNFKKGDAGIAQVVECLPSKNRTLRPQHCQIYI